MTPDEAVEILRVKNIAIREGTFAGAQAVYGLRCLACGHEWSKNLRNYLWNTTGCPNCWALKRGKDQVLPLDEVRKRLADVGVSLLSDSFRGNAHAHDFRGVACGHIWTGKALHHLHGRGCPACGDLRRAAASRSNPAEVAEKLRPLGLELLEPYRNAHDSHRFKCPKGHIWSTGPHHVLVRGTGCPDCAGQVVDVAAARLQLAQRGITMISEYGGAFDKVSFQCVRGHVWATTLYSVLNSLGSGCSRCFAEDKEKKARDELKSRQLEIVGPYLGLKCQHTIRCISCGSRILGFLYQNCTKCHPHIFGVEEKKVRLILEQLTGHAFPRQRPVFLKGRGTHPLELDGYCEKLKVAFEYQGWLHYRPGYWSSGVANLRQQKLRDDRKRKACQRHGVLLICVPYWKQDVETFLRGKLLARGIPLI